MFMSFTRTFIEFRVIGFFVYESVWMEGGYG